MRRILLILIVLAAAGTGFGIWYFDRAKQNSNELLLYGNVDLRQIQLAFNNSERIAAVLKQEGDRVHKGEILAELDTGRLKPQVAQAEAQAAAQREVVARMHAGSRIEEKAQGHANVASAKADLVNAQ